MHFWYATVDTKSVYGAVFFRTIDGMVCNGTVEYGTVGYGALVNSDKNGLPIVY